MAEQFFLAAAAQNIKRLVWFLSNRQGPKKREKIAKEEAHRARTLLAQDLDEKVKSISDLTQLLNDRNGKLAAAQKEQAELKRKERELDDARRELELTVETKVQESIAEVRKNALRQAEDSLKLKVAEKDEIISQLQQKIEDLKRKAEQGSQQLQGEVQELELESILSNRFPTDNFQPVLKGQFGADVLQHVISSSGLHCGTIIWESKRTKNWSDGWLAKLKADQRTAKADAAILVSRALPKDIDSFDQLDGI